MSGSTRLLVLLTLFVVLALINGELETGCIGTNWTCTIRKDCPNPQKILKDGSQILRTCMLGKDWFGACCITGAEAGVKSKQNNLTFLNDDQLFDLLENSDIEGLDDEDIPNLDLVVANQSDEPPRCPSPPNSDVPLDVRLAQENMRIRWRSTTWNTPIIPPLVEPPVEQLLGPSEYFGRYITEELFDLMAVESNKYSLMTRGKELGTTPSELKRFIGMNLIMGTIRYPRIRMYWDQKYRMPTIADTMTRNRFTELRQNLHMVDNNMLTDNEKKKNRFYKIQPIVDSVRNRCRELPRQVGDYSIDEQMVPFLGACPSRQYVKKKPRPVGLKNFVCTTSTGLVVDFELYQGKETPWVDSGLGLGANVILHLSQTLLAGSRLYFDRYFSSINLLDALRERGLFCTATIMGNRLGKFFKLKPDKTMMRGDVDEKVRGDDAICVTKWKDNKGVLMISSIFGKEPLHEVKRWDKSKKEYSNVSCPTVVKMYNEKMGGVDVCDQQMEAYRTFFKTKKWPLKAIIHFVDLSAVNSWMEYVADAKANGVPKKDRLDLLKLRLAIAEKLMAAPSNIRYQVQEESEDKGVPTAKRPLCNPLLCKEKQCDSYSHWSVMDDLKTNRNCRMDGCRSRTRVRCTKCNIYLCLSVKNNCFNKFHNK